jgi:hypothetical protein
MWLGWRQYDTAHLHLKGCPSGDNWQTVQTRESITSLVIYLIKDRMWHPVSTRTLLYTAFSCIPALFKQWQCCWHRDPNYDRLWKLRNVFDSLNDTYSKYYASSEHLDVNEVWYFSKEGEISNTTQTFWNQNLQIVWQDWLHIWHGGLFRAGQDTTDCRDDNTFYSKVLYK